MSAQIRAHGRVTVRADSANNGETLSDFCHTQQLCSTDVVADPKGNPVGSREAEHLSQRCKEVLVGTILGDGCLERNGFNVRLRIDHSLSQQAFVDWKWRELKELNPSMPRVVRRVDGRTGVEHCNYRFSTRSLSV